MPFDFDVAMWVIEQRYTRRIGREALAKHASLWAATIERQYVNVEAYLVETTGTVRNSTGNAIYRQ